MHRKDSFKHSLALATALLGTALCFCERASGQTAILNAVSSPSQISALPYLDLQKAEAERLHSDHSSETNRAQHYDLKSAPTLFNKADPTKGPAFHPQIRYEYGPDFDPLHIQDASLIVVGKIMSMTEHLSNNGTFVYSTFVFRPTHNIKGTAPAGDMGLERQGGVVMFPSGEKRYIGVFNFGLPLPGHTYMLMVAPSPITSNSYAILGGYEIDDNTTISLDREGHSFDKMSPSELEALIQKRVSR